MEVMPNLLSKRTFQPVMTKKLVEPGYREAPDSRDPMTIVFAKVCAAAKGAALRRLLHRWQEVACACFVVHKRMCAVHVTPSLRVSPFADALLVAGLDHLPACRCCYCCRCVLSQVSKPPEVTHAEKGDTAGNADVRDEDITLTIQAFQVCLA